jgi:uncharacterized membrane protein
MQIVPIQAVPTPLPRHWPTLFGKSRAIGRGTVVVLAALVALASYRYLFDFGPIPPNIAANRYRSFWLATHAGFAATALLVGAAQFSNVVRDKKPAIHRVIGRIYVISCLVGGSAGFLLALGSSSGAVASLGFGGLAIAWLLVNVLGWWTAVTRDFAGHRRWMIRSWALTLSGVTLRIYLTLAEVTGLPELPAYQIISFLCWVPNLIAGELLLRHRSPRHAPKARA